jgi:hypothetical protein
MIREKPIVLREHLLRTRRGCAVASVWNTEVNSVHTLSAEPRGWESITFLHIYPSLA